MTRTYFLILLLFFPLACSSSDESDPGAPGATDASIRMSEGDQGGAVRTDSGSIPARDASVSMDSGQVAAPDSGQEDTADCVALCEYLERCGGCFQDAQGECLDIPACTTVCTTETPPAVAACVAQIDACSDAEFEGCYNANIGDDDCAQTCRFLESCGECFTDADGNCLTLAGCALVCRESTPPRAAACIANLSDCAGIGDCYNQ